MTVNDCGSCPALIHDEVPRCSFWMETIRMCWDECEYKDEPELLEQAIQAVKDWRGIL